MNLANLYPASWRIDSPEAKARELRAIEQAIQEIEADLECLRLRRDELRVETREPLRLVEEQ